MYEFSLPACYVWSRPEIAHSTRLAIVTVCGTSCAEKARKEMNGKQIHGRAIKVDPIRQPGVGWQNASKHCSYTPAPVQERRAESCDGKQLRVSSQTGPLIHQTGPVAPPKVTKIKYIDFQNRAHPKKQNKHNSLKGLFLRLNHAFWKIWIH